MLYLRLLDALQWLIYNMIVVLLFACKIIVKGLIDSDIPTLISYTLSGFLIEI